MYGTYHTKVKQSVCFSLAIIKGIKMSSGITSFLYRYACAFLPTQYKNGIIHRLHSGENAVNIYLRVRKKSDKYKEIHLELNQL